MASSSQGGEIHYKSAEAVEFFAKFLPKGPQRLTLLETNKTERRLFYVVNPATLFRPASHTGVTLPEMIETSPECLALFLRLVRLFRSTSPDLKDKQRFGVVGKYSLAEYVRLMCWGCAHRNTSIPPVWSRSDEIDAAVAALFLCCYDHLPFDTVTLPLVNRKINYPDEIEGPEKRLLKPGGGEYGSAESKKSIDILTNYSEGRMLENLEIRERRQHLIETLLPHLDTVANRSDDWQQQVFEAREYLKLYKGFEVFLTRLFLVDITDRKVYTDVFKYAYSVIATLANPQDERAERRFRKLDLVSTGLFPVDVAKDTVAVLRKLAETLPTDKSLWGDLTWGEVQILDPHYFLRLAQWAIRVGFESGRGEGVKAGRDYWRENIGALPEIHRLLSPRPSLMTLSELASHVYLSRIALKDDTTEQNWINVLSYVPCTVYTPSDASGNVWEAVARIEYPRVLVYVLPDMGPYFVESRQEMFEVLGRVARPCFLVPDKHHVWNRMAAFQKIDAAVADDDHKWMRLLRDVTIPRKKTEAADMNALLFLAQHQRQEERQRLLVESGLTPWHLTQAHEPQVFVKTESLQQPTQPQSVPPNVDPVVLPPPIQALRNDVVCVVDNLLTSKADTSDFSATTFRRGREWETACRRVIKAILRGGQHKVNWDLLAHTYYGDNQRALLPCAFLRTATLLVLETEERQRICNALNLGFSHPLFPADAHRDHDVRWVLDHFAKTYNVCGRVYEERPSALMAWFWMWNYQRRLGLEEPYAHLWSAVHAYHMGDRRQVFGKGKLDETATTLERIGQRWSERSPVWVQGPGIPVSPTTVWSERWPQLMSRSSRYTQHRNLMRERALWITAFLNVPEASPVHIIRPEAAVYARAAKFAYEHRGDTLDRILSLVSDRTGEEVELISQFYMFFTDEATLQLV